MPDDPTTGAAGVLRLLRERPPAVPSGPGARTGRTVLVLGAPGTGKSRLAVEVVADAVATRGLAPEACAVLAPTRAAAARLRHRVTAAVARTTTEPLARTPASLAFTLLSQDAAIRGLPTPRLLSGAEQDLVLGELLQGHAETGGGPVWPESMQGALSTRGFRHQLRDLLMRTVEHGVSAQQLAELGREHDRPEWVAAADMLTEYDQVTALSRPGAYDPAWICTAAADLLEDDAAAAQRVRERVRLIVVDDAQELTASAARLVQVMAGVAADVVLIGDGDATVQGFRGAEPSRFAGLADDLSGPEPARTVVLSTGYRRGPELTAAAERVAQRIGVSCGVEHRTPEPSGPPGSCTAVVVRSAAQEVAHVAEQLRRAHLMEQVPWSQMAVIVRSRNRHEALRRGLARAEIPITLPGGGVSLAQHPAVRMLMTAFRVALREPGEAPAATADEAVALVSSALGGADPVRLRRLRVVLRAAELEAGRDRLPDEAMAELIDHPQWATQIGPEAEPLHRVGTVIAAGRRARGGTAEEVLWALWEASGLAGRWEQAATGRGAMAERADRDLDAMMVLFGAAADFTERLPGADPAAFESHVAALEVAPDTLVDRSTPAESVAVLTPQTAAGLQWRRVFVVGVQEGVWPDLRLRDTLLGAQLLVDVVAGLEPASGAGVRQAQARIRADELRQFYCAVTRASEAVVVTAVAAAEEQPSPYLDLLDPLQHDRPVVDVGHPLTVRGAVAGLRRALVRAHREHDTAVRDACAAQLARLTAAGADGADPAHWWLERELTEQRPLSAQLPAPVSPSTAQLFTECPLRWLLSLRGGQAADRSDRARVGTLVHDIISEQPEADAGTLTEKLEHRWGELGLGAGWIVEQELERARGMMHRYADYHRKSAADGYRLVGVEADVRVDVGDARITGRVDRVEVDADGRLRIVDLKTSSSVPSVADTEQNPQLGCYQVAVEAGALERFRPGAGEQPEAAELGAGQTPRSAGAALVILGKPGPRASERQQAPVSEAPDPAWAQRLVSTVASESSGAAFPARPGGRCRTCPVIYSCPAHGEGQMLS